MKSFYTALFTMIISLSLIISSSIYISYLLNDMYGDAEGLTEALSDVPSDDLDSTLKSIEMLSQKWKKSKWIFEIFVPHHEVTYTEIELHNISAYAKTLNDSAYRAARSRLLARIEELSDAVRISLEAIF